MRPPYLPPHATIVEDFGKKKKESFQIGILILVGIGTMGLGDIGNFLNKLIYLEQKPLITTAMACHSVCLDIRVDIQN